MPTPTGRKLLRISQLQKDRDISRWDTLYFQLPIQDKVGAEEGMKSYHLESAMEKTSLSLSKSRSLKNFFNRTKYLLLVVNYANLILTGLTGVSKLLFLQANFKSQAFWLMILLLSEWTWRSGSLCPIHGTGTLIRAIPLLTSLHPAGIPEKRQVMLASRIKAPLVT